MEDRFDVVAVWIENERGVVVAAVLGTHAGRSDVCPAVAHCSVVPAPHRVGVTCAERDVRTGRHPVAAGLAPDRVNAEVVAVVAPEQGVGVTFELTFGEHDESKLRKRGLVHPPTRCHVAGADADVVDDLAHPTFSPLSVGSFVMGEP